MKTRLILFSILLFFFAACEKDDDQDQPSNTLQADAGTIDEPIVVGELLILDGSASNDNADGAFDYLWTLKSKPQGSESTLEDETTATPEITPDVEGDYVIELEISNNEFSDTDEISFTATAPEEPQAQVINADITQDRRLENIFTNPDLIDYLITTDIHVTALLQIDPGVTIAFEEDKAMYIDNQGAILAVATPTAQVKFTGKEETPGFWKGLVINSGSTVNKLENIVIEYGGSSAPVGVDKPANLSVTKEGQGNIVLSSTTLRHSSGYGLLAENGSTIDLQRGMIFSNNAKPLQIPASQIANISLEMEIDNNEEDIIEVEGDKIFRTEETFWAMNGTTPYFVKGKIEIASGLKIHEGTNFFFDENAEVVVTKNGYLNAIGTNTEPIKFYGKETSAGFWKGIAIESDSENNELQYVEISGAGSEIIEGHPRRSAVSIKGENATSLKLSESKILKSGGTGLYVDKKATLEKFEHMLFENNLYSAVAVEANMVANFADYPALEYNGNGHDGVEIYESILSAPENNESIWQNLPYNVSYFISGRLGIRSGLKVLPGTVFRFAEDKYLRIFPTGYLNAQGNDAMKIVFTAVNQTKGSWNGILIQSNSEKNVMDFTEVRYAGKNAIPETEKIASIILDSDEPSSLMLKNSRISHGLGYGIALEGNRASINSDVETANQFEDLTMGNIYK